MKKTGKILSALILTVEFCALFILMPHLTDSRLRNAFFTPQRAFAVIVTGILGFFSFLYINIFPRLTVRKTSTRRNQILEDGAALLQLFLVTVTTESAFVILYLLYRFSGPSNEPCSFSEGAGFLIGLLLLILAESVLFWNGILRVYTTSVQLGLKWRVIGIICGFIPIVHIWVLCRIIGIASREADFENEKHLLDQVRAHSQICQTKYPLLLVHGVFFRDFRFFNYWGRIPHALKQNGAVIYYGNQQSAASVAACGQELAERIRTIVRETGCEKVNIVAHSKGGLDSRYAISRGGAAPYVASLTTVNTPHRGCIFADYLLDRIPDRVCQSVAVKYNAALKRFGDREPDFLEAVQDLTASSCSRLNELLPDDPQVYYQSVGSRMHHAVSGRFPLNMSYPLVKHFDGECDGLVSLDSMKWGAKFICPEVPAGRGISHGDMIDLNRENIPGFDVREFYVNLVKDLKNMGL